jgi:hypothetical protein
MRHYIPEDSASNGTRVVKFMPIYSYIRVELEEKGITVFFGR